MSSNLKRRQDKKAKFLRTSFDDLPVEVQRLILERVPKVSGKYPKALLNLSSTCKTFRDILNEPSSEKLWEEAWYNVKHHRPTARSAERKLRYGLEYSAKQKLRLAGFTGCMICKAKGVRKVTWEFGIRCCDLCLADNTITEHCLYDKYDLPTSALCQLPYIYVSGLRSRRWKEYWKSSIPPVLQTNHGVSSFQEYDALKAERERIADEKRKAEEKEREEKRIKAAEQWAAQEKEREEQRIKAAEEKAIMENIRRERKRQLDAWLIQDNLNIPLVASHSQTYKRNSRLAAPLQQKNYKKLLQRIIAEIFEAVSLLSTESMEGIMSLSAAQDLLVKDTAAKKEAKQIAEEQAELARRLAEVKTAGNVRLAQLRKRQAQLARALAGEKSLNCSVCGYSREFKLIGLREHTRAVHPQQIPEALEYFNALKSYSDNQSQVCRN